MLLLDCRQEGGSVLDRPSQGSVMNELFTINASMNDHTLKNIIFLDNYFLSVRF